jgi:2-oxoglutarate ferredoxin oxidoreductase subunit alpha
MTVEAFNIAETYRTPVVLLFDEVWATCASGSKIPEPGEIPLVERLRTSVKRGVDYHPYLPGRTGACP